MLPVFLGLFPDSMLCPPIDAGFLTLGCSSSGYPDSHVLEPVPVSLCRVPVGVMRERYIDDPRERI